MASKLTGNGVFEGSRIILPEYRDAYLREMSLQERRGKPVLDEQEMLLIEDAIFESHQECRSVALTVFSPFDDEELRGVITSIDKPNRKVKIVRGEGAYSWPRLEEIIKATI